MSEKICIFVRSLHFLCLFKNNSTDLHKIIRNGAFVCETNNPNVFELFQRPLAEIQKSYKQKIDKISIKMHIKRVAQIFDCHFKIIEDNIIEICNKLLFEE